jgi:aryl-alcohol dehydrogenase-like predicted oxidoreductase
LCQREKLTVLPWSPLAGGLLTGRYHKEDTIPENTRVSWAENFGFKVFSKSGNDKDQTWDIIAALEKIAKEINKTPSQVALRWLLQKKTLPIIGAKTTQQLIDNLGSIGWELSSEHMKELDQVSDTPRPYPWVSNTTALFLFSNGVIFLGRVLAQC